MDDSNKDINNTIKKLLSTSPLGVFDSTHEPTATTCNCVEDIVPYPKQVTLKLIPDNIAKELHKAIALGVEPVKRSLAMWYSDPSVLATMTALVDTCVAYIGEEVTTILRKYSNI